MGFFLGSMILVGLRLGGTSGGGDAEGSGDIGVAAHVTEMYVAIAMFCMGGTKVICKRH